MLFVVLARPQERSAGAQAAQTSGLEQGVIDMPRYAALIYGDAATETAGTPDEWATIMQEYNDFGDRAVAAGVMAGGEALQPTPTATTVHVTGGSKGGDVVLTDGPFAETKEVLGGFYLLDCADLDEAIRWAAAIPGAWRGRVEVRPVIDFSQNG
jgi:hypothetical protein